MSDVPDCLFCKIVRKEIQADEVARNDDAVAIVDVNPQAPIHYLVIPARHVTGLGDFTASSGDREVAGLFGMAARLGREASPSGYRLVTNEGKDAGQTVMHLHLHVLAGRPLSWPPG